MNNALIYSGVQDNLKHALDWNGNTFSGENIMSFIVMGFIVLLSFVVFFTFKGKDPTKPDRNKFITVCCAFVGWLENYTVEMMGKKWKGFTGYSLSICLYVFISFFIGISGLPGPLTILCNTLSLGLCTFILIHATAVKANKWKYFKRYVDPMPLFLPINLLSMWAPLLSLSLRLFGNAISGFAIEIIDYYFLELLSDAIFGKLLPSTPFPGPAGMFVAPIVMPVLHLYFDVFSGAIQAFIFISLSSLWVSQEDPDEEEEAQASVKGEAAVSAA
jgi:F-type H+-transporting ATPase subunit a